MLAGLHIRHNNYTIEYTTKIFCDIGQSFLALIGLIPEKVIQKIDPANTAVAQQLYELFQASYAVEAKLLGAVDFPPLKRKAGEFAGSGNDFYGYFVDDVMAAATEVDKGPETTHIQSLVVHPRFFRRGIGAALVNFVLEEYDAGIFTVETGAANAPATQLYRKMGFRELYEYDTDHGVRKGRFELRISD